MSELDALPGNIQAKDVLKKLVATPPHTLLFEGPKGVGKKRFARAFARELLQSTKKEHPDFFELFPEGKSQLHPMHSIRNFIQATEMPPFEAEYKVFIIHDADRMLPFSANALLKTLEEPSSKVTIILLSSRPDSLLPTITSRCFSIPFVSLTEEEITQHLSDSVSKDEARSIALLAHGSLEKAEGLAHKESDQLSADVFELGVMLIHREIPSEQLLKKIPSSEDTLSYLFYFFRDLHLLQTQASPDLLFFRHQQDTLKKCLECPLPSLDVIQLKMEKLEKALEVHIPLSHALCEFYF